MKHLFALIALLFTLQPVSGKDCGELYYDTVKVSINEVRSFTVLEITVDSKCTYLKFSYYQKEDSVSGGFKDVEVDIGDIGDSTEEYLRKSIIHYFIKRDKRKYQYFKKLNYLMYSDPGPSSIGIEYIKGQEKFSYFMNLTSNVKSKTKLSNDFAEIIYTDEYGDFLQTMLNLSHKYCDKYMKRYR